jgi:hypothetical protein
VQALWSLPLANQVHPVTLAAIAVAILVLDYLTGPHVHIEILFVFPAALATWKVFLYFVWNAPTSWALEAVDTAIDLIVLLVLVQVIGYIARQRRAIHVLQGMLPICGFCKRIRDEGGGWLQLEQYIAERSEASFSHTFCPECGRIHYGNLVD